MLSTRLVPSLLPYIGAINICPQAVQLCSFLHLKVNQSIKTSTVPVSSGLPSSMKFCQYEKLKIPKWTEKGGCEPFHRDYADQLKALDPVFDLIRVSFSPQLVREWRVWLGTNYFNGPSRYVGCFVVKVLKVSGLIEFWNWQPTKWRDWRRRVLWVERFP